MADIEVKQGEAKTVRFTVTNPAGAACDLSSAEMLFGVKEKFTDSAYTIEKRNADFNVAQAASGIISINLDSTNTEQTPGKYKAELKIRYTATNIDKSSVLDMRIRDAVTVNV
jgi:hypothetical protein